MRLNRIQIIPTAVIAVVLASLAGAFALSGWAQPYQYSAEEMYSMTLPVPDWERDISVFGKLEREAERFEEWLLEAGSMLQEEHKPEPVPPLKRVSSRIFTPGLNRRSSSSGPGETRTRFFIPNRFRETVDSLNVQERLYSVTTIERYYQELLHTGPPLRMLEI